MRYSFPWICFFCFLGVVQSLFHTLVAEEVETVWLDEMNLEDTICGWKEAQANRSVEGAPISIGGKVFERGVGNHAPSQIAIAIPDGKGIRFLAEVGLNDEEGSSGPAEFRILAGSKLLWQSGPMKRGDLPQSVAISIDGVSVLRLVSEEGENYFGDHTSWGNVRIEFRGERPRTIALDKDLPFDEAGMPLDRMDEVRCEWWDLKEQIAVGMKPNVRAEALHPAATILETDRDPLDIVTRRLIPLVEELSGMPKGPELTEERAILATLREKAERIPVEELAERQKVFAETVALRKKIAFQNPLLNFRDILFLKRHPCDPAEERGNHMCDQYFGFNALPGGGIFVLQEAFSESPKKVDSLADFLETKDSTGKILNRHFSYLSPELSHDNQELYFSAADTTPQRWKAEWTAETCFHLFKARFHPETGLLSDVKQLTDGAFNDFDPCCLPSGRIAFISERRGGYGRCHPRIVPTYTLHSMEPDGSDITMLSPHETNEWQPDVDHAGMILYTRWDYVDRGANNAHHPWTTTPDGRDPRAIHGNYSESAYDRPLFEADIHPVPNSSQITAIACAHHGQHFGSLVLVNPQVRDDNKMSPIRRITPEQLFPESELPIHHAPARYGTCRPLSEHFYLVVFDAFGRGDKGSKNNYGIYLLDCYGNRVLIYRDPEISCYDAQPIRPRQRQPIVPHQTLVGIPGTKPGEATAQDQLPQTATIGLINVYDTSLPFPKQPNSEETVRISRLRVVQLLPKTTPLESQPAIGYGHQKGARRILGTVPVEADGSAYFTVPVNIPIYFQALDENGVAVQSMRTDTYVHEGEELVCQGCHENRHTSMSHRSAGIPVAFRRKPSELQPDPPGTNPINYALLIQPILDARCVTCHAENADNPKAIDLSRGPEGNHFFHSFQNLRPYCFFYDHYLWTEPQTSPGKFGANASRLWRLLQSEHYGVHLTAEEKYRFALWMDNNCDFYGTYEHCAEQRAGQEVPIVME